MQNTELELVVPNDDDITLSAELADGRLSLSEIGAIFLIFAITQRKISDQEIERWSDESELQLVIHKFLELGLLTITKAEGGLHMKIDLSTYDPFKDDDDLDEDWDDDDWDEDLEDLDDFDDEPL